MNSLSKIVLFHSIDSCLPVQVGLVIDKNKVLIAQKKDALQKNFIKYNSIESNIISFLYLEDFSKQQADLCAKVFRYNEDFHYDMSWFEILQVAVTCYYMKNTNSSFIIEQIKKIGHYYNHVFSSKKFDYIE